MRMVSLYLFNVLISAIPVFQGSLTNYKFITHEYGG